MIEFTVPGDAPSTPNLREHHMARAKRVKAQRAAVALRMPAWAGGPLLVVRLTRVAPRLLDSDNLAAALKGHRDAVAARLRVDDASPLVEWEYHQTKGEAEVVVQIWRTVDEGPPLPEGRPVVRRLAPESGGTKRGKATGAPRERCNKNGCRRLLPCADHSHHLLRPACDAPTETLAFARALNAQPNYNAPPIPRASRTNPMATKAVVPSNAAEHRAAYAPIPEVHPDNAAFNAEVRRRIGLKAAQEAEATFAPTMVSQCDKCGVGIRAMDGGRCTPCVVAAFKEIAGHP